MLHIAGIDYESVKDGEGVRTAIYVSGCSHNCSGCHNPETHNSNYGILFTEELKKEIFENIKKRPYISGITFTGGDPLHENNLEGVANLQHLVQKYYPEKTIWLYTGYTWEQIMNPIVTDDFNLHRDELIKKRKQIVCNCDVLVEGRYIDKLRDISLKWRGSSNQNVIDVKKSLEQNKIVLWCD